MGAFLPLCLYIIAVSFIAIGLANEDFPRDGVNFPQPNNEPQSPFENNLSPPHEFKSQSLPSSPNYSKPPFLPGHLVLEPIPYSLPNNPSSPSKTNEKPLYRPRMPYCNGEPCMNQMPPYYRPHKPYHPKYPGKNPPSPIIESPPPSYSIDNSPPPSPESPPSDSPSPSPMLPTNYPPPSDESSPTLSPDESPQFPPVIEPPPPSEPIDHSLEPSIETPYSDSPSPSPILLTDYPPPSDESSPSPSPDQLNDESPQFPPVIEPPPSLSPPPPIGQSNTPPNSGHCIILLGWFKICL